MEKKEEKEFDLEAKSLIDEILDELTFDEDEEKMLASKAQKVIDQYYNAPEIEEERYIINLHTYNDDGCPLEKIRITYDSNLQRAYRIASSLSNDDWNEYDHIEIFDSVSKQSMVTERK